MEVFAIRLDFGGLAVSLAIRLDLVASNFLALFGGSLRSGFCGSFLRSGLFMP